MDDELPLGGNISGAVRVGSTVRRRPGSWTPAVHTLLEYLAQHGFEAPRPLGTDDRGREVLSWIEGQAVPGWPDPFPEWIYSPECLAAAAHGLRRFHDLVEGFSPACRRRMADARSRAARDHLPQRLGSVQRRVPRATTGGDGRLGHGEPRDSALGCGLDRIHVDTFASGPPGLLARAKCGPCARVLRRLRRPVAARIVRHPARPPAILSRVRARASGGR